MMRIPRFLGLLVHVGAMMAVVLSMAGEPVFDPKTVIPRAFPVIADPPLIEASKVTPEVVRDEELVLGVVVDGAARAYPINQLTGPRREIINDDLGGRAIAATW